MIFTLFEVNCFLKKMSDFFNFTVFVVFCLLLPSLIVDLYHVVSRDLQVSLFSCSFIWRFVDFVFKFYFVNGHEVFDVINFCYCCFCCSP